MTFERTTEDLLNDIDNNLEEAWRELDDQGFELGGAENNLSDALNAVVDAQRELSTLSDLVSDIQNDLEEVKRRARLEVVEGA